MPFQELELNEEDLLVHFSFHRCKLEVFENGMIGGLKYYPMSNQAGAFLLTFNFFAGVKSFHIGSDHKESRLLSPVCVENLPCVTFRPMPLPRHTQRRKSPSIPVGAPFAKRCSAKGLLSGKLVLGEHFFSRGSCLNCLGCEEANRW